MIEMRTPRYKEETSLLLNSDKILNTEDFLRAFPEMPKSSVYTRIRSLVKSGKLSCVGTGQYIAVHKPSRSTLVTQWMKDVNRYMIINCEGIAHCLTQPGSNLLIEVPKSAIQTVIDVLKQKWPNVVSKKDADRFPATLKDYILVGQLITDSPIEVRDYCPVPSIEKELVDSICNKKASVKLFQRAMEIYPVNVNRLHRYASRRGVEKELSDFLLGIKQERVSMFSSIQKYLSKTSITKAWIFGSFSRGEETEQSDLDLLVEYDRSSQISLLTVIRYKLDLEKLTGRKVDLVENGYLRPFAAESAEHDKYIIYER